MKWSKRTRVSYRNCATRVSVRWFNNSLIIRHTQVLYGVMIIIQERVCSIGIVINEHTQNKMK